MQRRKDVEERTTRGRREEQALRGELAPGDHLPGDEQQPQSQGEIDAGEPVEPRDETRCTDRDRRDPPARPLEGAATREEDQRVDVEELGQLEMPPVRRAPPTGATPASRNRQPHPWSRTRWDRAAPREAGRRSYRTGAATWSTIRGSWPPRDCPAPWAPAAGCG